MLIIDGVCYIFYHLLLPIIGLLQQFKDYVKGIAVEKDKQTKIISIRK
jgi:hypothetical protein